MLRAVLGNTYEDQNCSIARSLEFVGERWSLLIIRDAMFGGITRFADFQRHLGLARNVLSARLNHFVEQGLMERRPAGQLRDEEYVLTDKGRDLQPVLVGLVNWGDRWAAPNGPPHSFQHTKCGGEVKARVICGQCGEQVTGGAIAARQTGATGPALN